MHLNEPVAVRRTWNAKRDLLFLAMTHHRLGHDPRCEAMPDRGVTADRHPERPRNAPATGLTGLEDQILRREAEAVILYDPIFPADPFAPAR